MKENAKFTPLGEPAIYLPFTRRQYDTKPNLYRLGHDFGQGESDSRVLQFDRCADEYRQQKLAIRRSSYEEHYCDKLSPTEAAAVNRFLVTTLLSEHPQLFAKTESGNRVKFSNHLTGETLIFSGDYCFQDFDSKIDRIETPYRSGPDALANQLQEDLCVIRAGEHDDELVCAHLSFPNKWAPRDKLGKNFLAIHHPVAGFQKENRNANSMVPALMKGGRYVRFAWGLSADNELNHHPSRAKPLHFSKHDDPLFLRVERQVLVGLVPTNLLLFFIRTYYYDCHKICQDRETREALLASLNSMTDDTIAYKGLSQSKAAITGWLKGSC